MPSSRAAESAPGRSSGTPIPVMRPAQSGAVGVATFRDVAVHCEQHGVLEVLAGKVEECPEHVVAGLGIEQIVLSHGGGVRPTPTDAAPALR